ncbi:hypothetical protein CYMTET_42959 [Cymbomonas tetramitiformis]|uniref:Uncharacterized protein n=1 Tax=Cymbomonas tetramitiformis TaxID=36881 RepID=A0AAE0F244_9CHLO|nr:hypothetical protein CYMTET_42959 [Cymbomonas tetramitiformis]
MRWVLRSLSGYSEDSWRLLGVAPRLLLAPQPGGARKKSIPAELVRQRVARMRGRVRLIACGEALRRLTGKVVCRQMRGRFAAYFGSPPKEGANGGGVIECDPVVVRPPARLQARLQQGPLAGDLSGGDDEVCADFPELSGMIESCFRNQAMQRVAGGRW